MVVDEWFTGDTLDLLGRFSALHIAESSEFND